MKTAVDTNVSAILWEGLGRAPLAACLLAEANEVGSLSICPVVFSEMLANPNISEDLVHDFLQKSEIVIDLALSEEVWIEAGRRFREYGARRRRSAGGEPKRLLTDFIVAAHALIQADCLLTFDAGRYAVDFPELRLVDTRQ